MESTTEQAPVDQNTSPTTNLSPQTIEAPPVSHSKIIIVAVGLCIVAGSASALYYYKETLAPSLFAPKATLKVDKSLIIATSTSGVLEATTSKLIVESSSTSKISPDHFTQSDFTESDLLGRWTDKEGKGDNDWELIIDGAGKHIYKGYGKDGKLDCTDTWEMNNGMLSYVCASEEYKKDKSYVPFTISLSVTYNKVTGELTVVDEDTTSVWKRSGGVKMIKRTMETKETTIKEFFPLMNGNISNYTLTIPKEYSIYTVSANDRELAVSPFFNNSLIGLQGDIDNLLSQARAGGAIDFKTTARGVFRARFTSTTALDAKGHFVDKTNGPISAKMYESTGMTDVIFKEKLVHNIPGNPMVMITAKFKGSYIRMIYLYSPAYNLVALISLQGGTDQIDNDAIWQAFVASL